MRKPEDKPSHPYIIKVAPTGTAASIIQGTTLHNALGFNFGNEFYSLSDKVRDEKRALLVNLVAVIIDEVSTMKSEIGTNLI